MIEGRYFLLVFASQKKFLEVSPCGIKLLGAF